MSSPLSLSGLMMVGPMHIAQLLQHVTVLGVAVLLLVTLRPFVRRRGGRIALVGAALLLGGAALDIVRILLALLSGSAVESLYLAQSTGLIVLVWALLAALRRR
ncbi:hypothetical protein [Stenotrophomonas rhizophila]